MQKLIEEGTETRGGKYAKKRPMRENSKCYRFACLLQLKLCCTKPRQKNTDDVCNMQDMLCGVYEAIGGVLGEGGHNVFSFSL